MQRIGKVLSFLFKAGVVYILLMITSIVAGIKKSVEIIDSDVKRLNEISDDIYTQGMTLVRQTEEPRETVLEDIERLNHKTLWEDIERINREAMKGSN